MGDTHCWRFARLNEIARIFGGGTPSREDSAFWNGDIPWITPGELTAAPSKVTASTNDRITDSGVRFSGAVLLPIGTLLVTTRATLGARTLAGVPMTTNQGFKNIVFDQRVADPEFYYHLFETLTVEMERRASGTTFAEISGSQFGKIRVAVPPLAEQRRIAETFDAIDADIDTTCSTLSKLALLKRGLISNLLTGRAQHPVRGGV